MQRSRRKQSHVEIQDESNKTARFRADICWSLKILVKLFPTKSDREASDLWFQFDHGRRLASEWKDTVWFQLKHLFVSSFKNLSEILENFEKKIQNTRNENKDVFWKFCLTFKIVAPVLAVSFSKWAEWHIHLSINLNDAVARTFAEMRLSTSKLTQFTCLSFTTDSRGTFGMSGYRGWQSRRFHDASKQSNAIKTETNRLDSVSMLSAALSLGEKSKKWNCRWCLSF